MSPLSFHLLPNAHLDPVWLWDWREGLNEGIVTCRTMLELMNEYEELTFIRGEAVVYQHIAAHDPECFDGIRARIAEGRWDVVGGTWLQPDTNLPATESFVRQFLHGQHWFREHLGQQPRIVWTADSFGHSAGLPEIYAAAGMEGLAFSRPGNSVLPIGKPLFWWEGQGGSRLLSWRIPAGWYGADRGAMPQLLDSYLQLAESWGIRNIPIFFGVGNHGGGATRRQIEDVLRWRDAHPEVEVNFSGLHRVFEAMRAEVAAGGEDFLPVHRGEINYCLRGCYVSGAQLKFAYRRAEAALQRAESIDTAIAAHLAEPPAKLTDTWRELLFNAFHDILPGSSIEGAIDDQLAQLGGILHQTQRTELASLNALAARVETRVPEPEADMPCRVPRLIFNPHPFPWRGPLEIEAHLDYRPLWDWRDRLDELPIEVRAADGSVQPHQLVQPAHRMMPNLPWRVRAVIEAELPPFGWAVYDIGYVKEATQPALTSEVCGGDGWISNGKLQVRATRGNFGIQIDHDGQPLLNAPGLTAITVEDPYGSWGEMQECADSFDLSDVRHAWRISDARVLDRGPLHASLWVRMTGGASTLELTCHLYRGRAVVDIEARLIWNERAARLKLVMPGAGESLLCDVPGATARRPGDGREVPGGRWVQVEGARPIGFASDAIYCFDLKDGALRASIVRGCGFATTDTVQSEQQPWLPTLDAGLFRFRCCITPELERLPELAAQLEKPPVQLHTAPSAGELPRQGSLLSLAAPLRLLALKPAEDSNGFILRLQNAGPAPQPGQLAWLGQELALGSVASWRISTWRLTRIGERWSATATSILE